MAFEIRYYNAISYKDDIEFVTEFACFLGRPVYIYIWIYIWIYNYIVYLVKSKLGKSHFIGQRRFIICCQEYMVFIISIQRLFNRLKNSRQKLNFEIEVEIFELLNP